MIPIQVDFGRIKFELANPPRTPYKLKEVRFNQHGRRVSCDICGSEILLTAGYPPLAILHCQCFVEEIMDETWVDEDVEAHKERARKFRPVL